MQKIFKTGLTLVMLLLTMPAMARLSVFACEPEWAALAAELGGERVTGYSATTAKQDPHHIEARPSLIARVRNADLLICSGAELEIGWLPLLLRQAGNAAVMPGRAGYLEAASLVQRLEIPTSVDRSMGDVHAGGNPHVHLDPRHIATIGKALGQRLAELDPAGSAYYQQRQQDFLRRWQQALERWQKQAAPLKGMRVVTHHRDWVYLFNWLGMVTAGTLEPRPGLPTTAGHLVNLKQELARSPAKMIVHAAYQDDRAAQRMSQLSGIPVLELPYTVGGAAKAGDLFSLFDVTLARLLAAAS